MINFKQIFDDIFIIIAKKQSIFEFILNLTFVLIIFIILVILYWDNINRTIINTGRCKIALNNSDLTYNLNIYRKKDNTELLNISYDNSIDKNYKVDCACPIGNTVNEFNLPIWNQKEKKINNIRKVCYCDNDYKTSIYDSTINSINKSEINMDGDSFLIDYYKGLLDSYQNGHTNYVEIDFDNNLIE